MISDRAVLAGGVARDDLGEHERGRPWLVVVGDGHGGFLARAERRPRRCRSSSRHGVGGAVEQLADVAGGRRRDAAEHDWRRRDVARGDDQHLGVLRAAVDEDGDGPVLCGAGAR